MKEGWLCGSVVEHLPEMFRNPWLNLQHWKAKKSVEKEARKIRKTISERVGERAQGVRALVAIAEG